MNTERRLLPILALFTFIALLFGAFSSPFTDMDNLPEGTLINTSVSPDGR